MVLTMVACVGIAVICIAIGNLVPRIARCIRRKSRHCRRIHCDGGNCPEPPATDTNPDTLLITLGYWPGVAPTANYSDGPNGSVPSGNGPSDQDKFVKISKCIHSDIIKVSRSIMSLHIHCITLYTVHYVYMHVIDYRLYIGIIIVLFVMLLVPVLFCCMIIYVGKEPHKLEN